MERFIEIAIITAQATYMVDTLEAMEAQRKFLRKVNEPIKRIEMRCYERDGGRDLGRGRLYLQAGNLVGISKSYAKAKTYKNIHLVD